MTLAVEVIDLVKRYPKRTVNAVDGVSFTVSPGEIFGFLGPNGAGKSTTIGVLTTRVTATSGSARVSGQDVITNPVRARSVLAVVPQRINLDRSISARQNLLFHAAYHGVGKAERERRADTLLAQFGLDDRGSDKVDRFSGGQSQRLMIARALMHQPEVLFLDEPSTGLDPQARLFVWDRVAELRAAGVTIMLTTHDMDEAAQLCDRIGIIDHGKLLALDTPEALTRSLPGRSTVDLTVTKTSGLTEQLASLPGVQRVEPDAGGDGSASASASASGQSRLKLYLEGEPAPLVAPIAAMVTAAGADLIEINFGRASLEDVFISLTGRGLR